MGVLPSSTFRCLGMIRTLYLQRTCSTTEPILGTGEKNWGQQYLKCCKSSQREIRPKLCHPFSYTKENPNLKLSFSYISLLAGGVQKNLKNSLDLKSPGLLLILTAFPLCIAYFAMGGE